MFFSPSYWQKWASILNSPGHHRWRTFGHWSRNTRLLQEPLGTAHWRSCSSWMCSHTAWPRYRLPGKETQQCLFRVTFTQCTGVQTVRMLTWKGPFSDRNPSSELQPGPPFSQSTRGSLTGSLWEVTNLQEIRTRVKYCRTYWKSTHASKPAAALNIQTEITSSVLSKLLNKNTRLTVTLQGDLSVNLCTVSCGSRKNSPRCLSCSTSCERTSKLSDKLQKGSFLPVMEKLSRPCLQVSRPLSIVRFEHHTWQVSYLVRGILSPGELKHGQQTHQQTTGEHLWTGLTSNYKKTQHYTTPLMD